MSEEQYVIYSPKHSKGEVIWWRANQSGYTRDLSSAGLYPKQIALEIEKSSHRDAIALKLSDVDRCMVVDHVIDLGRALNGQRMQELISKP